LTLVARPATIPPERMGVLVSKSGRVDVQFLSLRRTRFSLSIALLWCTLLSIALAQPPEPELASPVPEELPVPTVPEEIPGTIPLNVADEPLGADLTESDLQTMRPWGFGYNLRKDDTSWLVGGGDNFGMFSLESYPLLPPDKTWGVVSGVGIHWLGGPVRTDLPPRLLDFQIGLQRREWTSETFGYDVTARIGAFSDFEGSARQGIRYPGHAVGYYRWTPACDFVFGIEYLDRDDINLLPVAGLILTPRDDLRLELVFPRPRVEVRISPKSSIYLAGELGGGTWDIERPAQADDVVTYRDLRLLFGFSSCEEDGGESGFEIGYVFDRDLTYRSGNGDFAPGSTILIRLTERY
jgi:hypothetical protein